MSANSKKTSATKATKKAAPKEKSLPAHPTWIEMIKVNIQCTSMGSTGTYLWLRTAARWLAAVVCGAGVEMRVAASGCRRARTMLSPLRRLASPTH